MCRVGAVWRLLCVHQAFEPGAVATVTCCCWYVIYVSLPFDLSVFSLMFLQIVKEVLDTAANTVALGRRLGLEVAERVANRPQRILQAGAFVRARRVAAATADAAVVGALTLREV